MNSANQDKGKSVSNLQKLFSSHVLEKNCLKRQKSGLDHERRKKLKELNNNEHLFLRRYEKYVVPGSRSSRRSASIDPELAREIEANYSARNRPESQISNKAFAKDSINDACPYSLESWSKLVDSDKSIIDENKHDILFGDDKTPKEGNNSDEDTEMLLDEMFKANISLLESGRRLQRRQTLKPIETSNGSFNEDAIDEEIVEIQLKQKKRGRRHSVALGALYGGQLNRDTGLKLPSISERKGSFSRKKNSLSDPDFKAVSGKSKIHSSDENISFSERKLTKSGRSLSLADGRTELNMPSPVPEITKNSRNSDYNEAKSVSEGVNKLPLADDLKEVTKLVPCIRINNLDRSDVIADDTAIQRRNTPRPVANAAIFVQSETNDDKSSIFDTAVKKDNTEKTDHVDSDQNDQTSFLPRIELTKPGGLEEHISNSAKHVSFIEEDNEMRDRSDSNCSKLTNNSESSRRRGRRNTLCTATLKLLVDSHHGAAKLRYIARLAHEMEREEIAKHTPEPEPDIYQELNDCRYLRVVSRKGSAQSQDYIESDLSIL